MCTGKCAKCIGVTLYPLAAISILCNILLFFPDWSTRYMKEERVTAEVQYMGGLIGGGVMVSAEIRAAHGGWLGVDGGSMCNGWAGKVLIPAIHIHATGRAGCCANRCGMFLSIAFAAAGVTGALYSFTVAILGLVNGPTCLFSFAGESVWGTPFSVQYYGRNESYLMDRDLWKLCEEPKRVVEFNVALFSILIVAGATELLLCGFQVVNGLFGCLCGTCGSKGVSAGGRGAKG
ncbi:Transmembrane 4 L6 family member 4 [Acipenser ruthenus]|uniref:Transmembrane 4 L6 family member 4 n=1 Tax=Acipenser ruthenus TaxID=7906 RepID=A0A444UY29_ACIRT|nr:Transmembrane 4 L6 family member 4 [Acipenser ruthenus]